MMNDGLGRFLFLCLLMLFAFMALPLNALAASHPELDSPPAAVQGMTLHPAYAPSSSRSVAVIHGQVGKVWVARPALNEAYPAKYGDPLHEGDAVHTGAGARCRVRFTNGDVVCIASETHFSVDHVEDRREKGKKVSFFRLLKGKALFYALRLFRFKDMEFQVATPTAVAGVRGTKFGVHVFEDRGGLASKRDVRVATAGRDVSPYLSQAQPGASGLVTVFACGDGTLEITNPLTGETIAELEAHETFNSLTGRIGFDPLDLTLGMLESATRLPGQASLPSGSGGGQGDNGVPGQDGQQAFAELAAAASDALTHVVLQQGTSQAHGPGDTTGGIQPLPQPLKGYFSALLRLYGYPDLMEGFASMALQDTDPLPHAPDHAEAHGVNSAMNLLSVYEGSETHANINFLGVWKAEQIVEGPTIYLGQSGYLQWGYHMSDQSPIVYGVAPLELELLNKIWFVEGYPTPASELSSLSGTYHYTGDVFGTYYPGMTDLSGAYSCDVDFGAGKVQNFNFTAQGAGHTVTFTQTGSLTMSGNGEFALLNDGPDGTFKIDGSTIPEWSVNGAHFGAGADKALEQGGTWAGVNSITNVGAWGGFAGERTGP